MGELKPRLTRRLRCLLIVLCCTVFVLTAIALIPYPGIQNDEVFFASPIYSPSAAFYRAHVFHTRITFMVMSYSGALKTWIFGVIWRYFFDPSVWTLRLPVVLAGVGTIILTWKFVRRFAGARAAAITTTLLATDTCFQMTNTFDWGPVALQHLLLMAGLLAVFAWVRNGSLRMLAFGCFLWGLGLWDKALLIWPLIGLAVAVAAIWPREVFRRARIRSACIAVFSLLLGALPLVWYNVARPAATASTNAKFEFDTFGGKAEILGRTVNQSVLFGYMVRPADAPTERAPKSALERASVSLADFAGHRQTTWMVPALLLAAVVGLVFDTRRTAFLLVLMFVTWFQMAITKNAGGTAHHTILLWPFPPVLMGVALSALSRHSKVGVIFVVAVLAVQNLLVTNEYLAEFITNGTTVNWTDAVIPLSNALDSKMTSEIECTDWGYLNGVHLLHEGDLPLRVVADLLLKPELSEPERTLLAEKISSPAHLFIQHTDGNEIFPVVNGRLRGFAASMGYRERVERTIRDRNGRDIFELVRFEKIL